MHEVVKRIDPFLPFIPARTSEAELLDLTVFPILMFLVELANRQMLADEFIHAGQMSCME